MKSPASTLTLERYAPEAKAAIAGAQALADERKHPEVQPIHLLVRLLQREPGVSDVLRAANINPVEVASAAERALSGLPRASEPSYLSAATLDLLERAEREADREREKQVRLEHVLNALSQEIRGPAGEILGAFGVSPGSLRAHASLLKSAGSLQKAAPSAEGAPAPSEYTRDLLDLARRGRIEGAFGRDQELRRLLTILERRHKHHPLIIGEAGVGKSALIRSLARALASGDAPPSLAGSRLLELDTGALVAGARLRGEVEERVRKLLLALADGDGESVLVARNVDQLFGQGPSGSQVGELLRPALERGQLRLLGTTTPEGLRRLEDRDPNVLRLLTPIPLNEPTIDVATEIVRAVAGSYEKHHRVEISEGAIVSAVKLAKRYVQDRFLPDSALDLLDESAAMKRVALDGLPLAVDEARSRVDTVRAQLASLASSDDPVSRDTKQRLEAELAGLEPRVQQMKQGLEERRSAVTRLQSAKNELDRAIEQLERARADKDYARLGELEHARIPSLRQTFAAAQQAAERAGVAAEVDRSLTEEDVAKTLANWTGIPVARMLEGEAEKLLKMEQRLGERVVGQLDAVGAVARAVRRGRVGLRDPKRPIGSFLFLGPSGVGKTELAKALAEFLFDDEQALTRLDMSEFMERHMAQRLLGAPPGYVDSERGGTLTEAVRSRPYSVLLFDEVEKAHQDVFNLLLQVLDDGRLTDGRGRTADFSNTVVIMTSNIGSDRILSTDAKLFETPDGREALRDVLIEQLRSFFRPEFLNRIDEIVLFRPLQKSDLRTIVDIQLVGLERLLESRKLKLELTPEAKDRLVELGYEPGLGARPLRRAILKQVQDPLAGALLEGKFVEGSTVLVAIEGEEFVFRAGASA